MFFLDDTLESIFAQSRVSAAQCVIYQFRSRDYTISYFHSGDNDFLFTNFSFEFKPQFRFCHFRNIVERCFHRIATTYFVRDSLIVSFYFFSLEHSTLSFSFTAIPFQNRSNFYYSFFLEILFREFTINGSRNFTTYCFQHLWSNSEVVRWQGTHFLARREKCNNNCHE